MEFKEVVATRRSVRKFADRKVEREVIDELMAVVAKAPSSRNSHSTHYMVVTNSDLLVQIAGMRDYGSAFIKNAPAAIVNGDTGERSHGGQRGQCYDHAVGNTDMGLSSCWVHVSGRVQLQAQPDGAK